MLQEAQRAAESVRHLQALRDTYGDDKFQVTGVCLGTRGSLPGLHLGKVTLELVSDRSEWTWSERGCDEYPYRASVTVFDVKFYAIFSLKTAVEYGLDARLIKEWAAQEGVKQ